MKRVKPWICLLVIAAMAISLVACASNEPAAEEPAAEKPAAGAPAAEAPVAESPAEDIEPITIKMAGPWAESDPFTQTILYLQDRVDEMLPGRVTWENYFNGELGSESDIVNMVLDGTLAGTGCACSNLVNVIPITCNVIQGTPFLFESLDETKAFAEAFYAEYMQEEYNTYNLEIVTYLALGSQEIEMIDASCYDPESLKGTKIRGFVDDGCYAFIEAVGALPTSMAFNECYTGLQQKTIDGIFTSSPNFTSMKFCELCKYQSDLNISNAMQTILFNKEFLESLPQDLHDAIIQAGKDAQDYQWNVLGPEFDANFRAEVAANGCEICTPSEEQYQEFKTLVTDYCHDDFQAKIDADLWAKTIEFLEEYRA